MLGRAPQLGSRSITLANVVETSSPANGFCPVSISNSTAPKAHTSARLSTTFPLACSGAIYAAVPITIPICVAAAVNEIVGDCDRAGSLASGWNAFANPKSSTFTVPSSFTFTLAGFRSRWMTPCSCAASNASAICFAMGSASSTGIGPCLMRSASVGPSTSCRVAPEDCSPEALTRTGLGGFHHPALPLMWLMAMRPRFARESEAQAEGIVPTTQRTSAR